jgi:hypothetical protein
MEAFIGGGSFRGERSRRWVVRALGQALASCVTGDTHFSEDLAFVLATNHLRL